MLDEATDALSHLDADILEKLGERASALAALDWRSGRSRAAGGGLPAEIDARMRLFSSVLSATRANFTALERTADSGKDRPARGYGGFFDSLGLYEEEPGGDLVWPRKAGFTRLSAGEKSGTGRP